MRPARDSLECTGSPATRTANVNPATTVPGRFFVLSDRGARSTCEIVEERLCRAPRVALGKPLRDNRGVDLTGQPQDMPGDVAGLAERQQQVPDLDPLLRVIAGVLGEPDGDPITEGWYVMRLAS